MVFPVCSMQRTAKNGNLCFSGIFHFYFAIALFFILFINISTILVQAGQNGTAVKKHVFFYCPNRNINMLGSFSGMKR